MGVPEVHGLVQCLVEALLLLGCPAGFVRLCSHLFRLASRLGDHKGGVSAARVPEGRVSLGEACPLCGRTPGQVSLTWNGGERGSWTPITRSGAPISQGER
eukprot:3680544-Prymnesium_polylepis.1